MKSGRTITARIVAPPQHTTCTTADPDAAAAFISSAWGAHGRVDGLDPGRPIRIARLQIDHVSVTEAEFPGALHFQTDQWPCYLVAEVKAGTVQIGATARAERCAAGDVALAVRPGRPCSANTEDAEVSLTALSPEALQRITGDHATDGAPGVRFISNRPRSDAAAAQWETTVDYVTRL
ncbi:hypothetical protein [Mycolicibacterium rhodesiae]|uniref:Uncharacterized protein n=1 Tax=Mycolicibacterium rhodesiae TaxID=36814 RepID=A0A1X0IYT8_MYCRH|nr:hypothetical protein [Mycolicibacterium rhodesiae]ORB53743.1 hypothetical protein BST42_10000 [Mycolicibacterium rhodesiae]